MAKKIFTYIFILIVLVALWFIFNQKSNNNIIETENNTNTEFESIITPTEDPNVNLYTSKKLGLKFNYAIKDPSCQTCPDNKVIEEGNTISIKPGGGSITVFKKDPKVSLEDAIKKDFNAYSCKVIVFDTYEGMSNFFEKMADITFVDENESFAYPGELDDGSLYSELDRRCTNEIRQDVIYDYFLSTDKAKDRYISVDGPTQAVEAVLNFSDSGRVKTWMSTIEFLK